MVVAMGIAIITAFPALVLLLIALFHSLSRWHLRPIQALWLITILFVVAQMWVESQVLGTPAEPWLFDPSLAYSLVTGAEATYGLVVSRRSV